jgi:hypothetical protein
MQASIVCVAESGFHGRQGSPQPAYQCSAWRKRCLLLGPRSIFAEEGAAPIALNPCEFSAVREKEICRLRETSFPPIGKRVTRNRTSAVLCNSQRAERPRDSRELRPIVLDLSLRDTTIGSSDSTATAQLLTCWPWRRNCGRRSKNHWHRVGSALVLQAAFQHPPGAVPFRP